MNYTPPDLKTALHIDLEAKGLTQDDMGRAMGVSQQSVSKWIAAQKIPEARVEQLRQLLGDDSYTVQFLADQYQRKARGMGARPTISLPEVPEYLQEEPTVQATLDEARLCLPENLRRFFPDKIRAFMGIGYPIPDYESTTTVLCAADADKANDALITLLLHQRMNPGTKKRMVLALREDGGAQRVAALRMAAACAALGVVLLPYQAGADLSLHIQELERNPLP